MTIIEALADPRLLGAMPAFHDLSTWKRWLVFLTATYGLPLEHLESVTGIPSREGGEIFRFHTGRSAYVPRVHGGFQEVCAIVGRQAAKTRIGATICDYEAMRAEPEPDGTETYAALVAQDARNALRALFSYSVAPFEHVEALRALVPTGWRTLWRRARRVDSLTLDNGCRIAVYPCRPSAVRGIRARVAVLDELAFYRNSEGVSVDVEMLRSIRPCLATTGGKLVILSSPYGSSGALYDIHRRHFGRDDSPVLVWVASAADMNPTLSADYLQRMAEDDPEAYRSEVLGEFRAGVSQFFDPDVIRESVAEGVREREPMPGADVGHVDPSSGTSGSHSDDFAAAVARPDGERIVLVAIRRWRPPFNPSTAIAEAADFFRLHGIDTITRDAYAPGFVDDGFRQHGITVRPAVRDTSATFLELLPLINANRVSLLDDAELLRQLRGLERRRGNSGRDRIGHAAGQHDDIAAAAAAAIVRAHRVTQTVPLEIYGGYSGITTGPGDPLYDACYQRALARIRGAKEAGK